MSVEATPVKRNYSEKLWDALCPIIAVAFPITMFTIGILATTLVEIPGI